MKKRISCLLAALMLLGALSGCSGNDGNTPGNDNQGSGSNSSSQSAGDNEGNSGSGEPKTVTIVRSSMPAHVDPCYSGSADCGEIINMNASGLYYVDADNNVQLDLATAVVESEDHMTLTYTIGDHYFYYSDGSQGPKITAYDFEYAAKRAIDPIASNDNQDTRMMNAGVKNARAIHDEGMDSGELGVYATDENTLVIEFEVYIPYRDELLSGRNLAPQNEDFVKECGAEYGTSADTVLNSGAWILTDFSVGSTSITLEANPGFNGYNAGKSNVDTVTFVQIQDSQQALLAYQNGDVDIVNLVGEQVMTYEDDPAFVKFGQSAVTYLAVNCDEYNNENLRRALSHALDKDALCEQVLMDGSIPAYFMVPYNLTTDGSGKDFRETSKSFGELDIELAQSYWEQAKTEMGIETMSLDFLITSDENAYTVGAWVQDQFQKALPGLSINLVTVPFESKMNYVMGGDYGFAVVTWGADYADATAFLSCYVTGYPINVSHWSNPEYDQILYDCTEGDMASDLTARGKALQHAEELFMDGASVIPMYQTSNCLLVRTNISGINYHLCGNTYDYRTMNA